MYYCIIFCFPGTIDGMLTVLYRENLPALLKHCAYPTWPFITNVGQMSMVWLQFVFNI